MLGVLELFVRVLDTNTSFALFSTLVLTTLVFVKTLSK